MEQADIERSIKDGIRKFLTKVKHKDEAGYVPGRIGFNVVPLRKGTHIRTNVYKVDVTEPAEIAERLFVKEYISLKESGSPDNSGRERPDIDEEHFSELLLNAGGFTPKFYTSITHPEEKEGGKTELHLFKFTQRFDFSLDEKLQELFAKKEAIIRRDPSQTQCEDPAKAIRNTENEAGDWVRRFGDIIMLNNFLLNEKYSLGDTIGSAEAPKVRMFTHLDLAATLINYLDIILERMLPNMKDRTEWKVNFRYDEIIGELIEGVAGYFKNHTAPNKVSIFGAYPGHCLFNRDVNLAKPDYDDGNWVVKLREGSNEETKTPYTGLAICDLTKLGTYHPVFGLAYLYTNPSVARLLPRERLKPSIGGGAEDNLIDHLIVAEQKIERKNEKVFLSDIPPSVQREFLDRYSRASIWALMRPLYFIAALGSSQQQELEQTKPVCQPESFARHCIRGILDIYDSAGNFANLKRGFEELDKVLNRRKPFSSRYPISR